MFVEVVMKLWLYFYLVDFFSYYNDGNAFIFDEKKFLVYFPEND